MPASAPAAPVAASEVVPDALPASALDAPVAVSAATVGSSAAGATEGSAAAVVLSFALSGRVAFRGRRVLPTALVSAVPSRPVEDRLFALRFFLLFFFPAALRFVMLTAPSSSDKFKHGRKLVG